MTAKIITNSPRAFWLAFRPKTLGAMVCPILVGSILAWEQNIFNSKIFFITLVCGILLQILTNLVNDYCDFMRGNDTYERLGPPRAMQMGWLTPKVMQVTLGINFLGVLLLGLILVFIGGWPILLLGLCAIIFCIWYSYGPVPLSYLGIAEPVVFLCFGLIPVLGTYFLQTGVWDLGVAVASICPGLLSTALLLTNNLRDIQEDTKNSKKTIVVRFGESFGRISIVVLLLFVPVVIIILIKFFDYSYFILLALLSLIFCVKNIMIILREPITKRFNIMLASFGKALYLFGVLFCLGIMCAKYQII